MSTDSQGRPLSDDGQWAWSGTEWVPAASGESPTAPQSDVPDDPGATRIAPSPFTGGAPAAGGQPHYGGAPQGPQTPQAPQPTAGAAPGYGSTPGYSGAPGYGTPGAPPPQKKSRTPLIAAIVGGLVVIAAIVVVLIFWVFGGDDKKSGPTGAYTCTAPGQSGSGVITFNSGDKYTLSDKGKGGSYTRSGDKITFKGGDLDTLNGTYSSGDKTVKFDYKGIVLTCKK